MVEFTPWPNELASRYKDEGYWIDLPLTDILSRRSEDDNVAVVHGDQALTYRELNELSDQLAAALAAEGLKRGDTAVVQLGNVPELYVVYFGLMKLGVVLVNALFSHQRLELEAYVQQVQPSLLVADREHSLFKDGDSFIDHLKTVSPNLRVTAFRDRLPRGDASNFTETPTPASEVAFFNLSGGSTGTPKLIPRTHNDYYYSVRQSVVICKFDVQTRYLCAIPAAHNFPMSSPGALGVFYAGGRVILVSDPSPTTCFPAIEKHKVNVAALVPPAASLWMQETETLPSLKLLQVGGARMSPVLAARLSAKFVNCKLQQVFGMAEGLVNYTRLDDDDETRVFVTQGSPMSPADEVWVADAVTGERLGLNEVGLLMTRGPYTFRGYYKAPEHNQKSFDKDGFYCSGDLVSMDANGYLTVHGRQKDQINRGGEKFATEEVENLLLRHELVLEVGIVSVEDEVLGEKSCAFVMTREPVKTAELRRFLRNQGIAEYKLPDKFTRVEDIPLTPVGKVDKKQLRQLMME